MQDAEVFTYITVMKKTLITAACCCLMVAAMAQRAAVETLIIPQGIQLPKDSVVRAGLIGSLRGWLEQRVRPDSMNEYVSRAELPETSVMMDELRGIYWFNRKDSGSSCRCYLGNVVSLDSLRCLVQLNYMGMRMDTPMLRACYTVLARREGDKWIISSVLGRYAVDWKTKTVGNCVFHYKETLNVKKAGEFVKRIASYDKRLGVVGSSFDFYCCDDWVEATKLLGEDYRLDYNGYARLEFASDYGNRTVVVSGEKWKDGFNEWDPHDWWHGRLHRVVSPATIYRPMDEGMAYLYGGSWRVYGWDDVLRMLKDYADSHPDADWLALYKKGAPLVTTPWPIFIPFAIDALIVQRLEKEKGFAAALPLVTCGSKQAGDANFFAALKQVVGVDEAGFNVYVAGLVKDQVYIGGPAGLRAALACAANCFICKMN
jgi:hypothetical protein